MNKPEKVYLVFKALGCVIPPKIIHLFQKNVVPGLPKNIDTLIFQGILRLGYQSWENGIKKVTYFQVYLSFLPPFFKDNIVNMPSFIPSILIGMFLSLLFFISDKQRRSIL